MTSIATIEGFITRLSDKAQSQMVGLAEVVLDFDMLGSMISWTAGALRSDGTWQASRILTSLDGADGAFEAEKLSGYTKGEGTWFMLRATLKPGADPVIERYDSERPAPLEVALKMPISADGVQAELAIFPRTRENIPDWMRERLEAEGLDIPFLDQMSDEIVMGPDRMPYEPPVL